MKNSALALAILMIPVSSQAAPTDETQRAGGRARPYYGRY